MAGIIYEADSAKGFGGILWGALLLVLLPLVFLSALIGWGCGKLREKARGEA